MTGNGLSVITGAVRATVLAVGRGLPAKEAKPGGDQEPGSRELGRYVRTQSERFLPVLTHTSSSASRKIRLNKALSAGFSALTFFADRSK